MENEVARRLREDAQEIDRSLDEFMRNRVECMAQQARAVDDYNDEMARIHDEHGGALDEPTGEVERTDHNLNRHLALSKKADFDPDEYPEYDESTEGRYDEGRSTSRFARDYVDVPKKECVPALPTPPPTFSVSPVPVRRLLLSIFLAPFPLPLLTSPSPSPAGTSTRASHQSQLCPTRRPRRRCARPCSACWTSRRRRRCSCCWSTRRSARRKALSAQNT